MAVLTIIAAILISVFKGKSQGPSDVDRLLSESERIFEKRERASRVPETISGFYNDSTANPSQPRGPVQKAIDDHPSFERIFPSLNSIAAMKNPEAREEAFLTFYRDNLEKELPFFMEFFHAMHDIVEEGRTQRFGPAMTVDEDGMIVVDMALWNSTYQFLQAWSEQNAFASMEYVITSKNHTDLADHIPDIIEIWSKTFPDELLQYAQEIVTDTDGETTNREQIWTLTQSMLTNQNQQFLDWALALSPEENEFLIEEMLRTLPASASRESAPSAARIIDKYESSVDNPKLVEDLSTKLVESDASFAMKWAMNRRSDELREAATRKVLETLAEKDPLTGVEIINSTNWKTSDKTDGNPSEFDKYTGVFISQVVSIHPQDKNLLIDMIHSAEFIQDPQIKEATLTRAKEAADRYHPQTSFESMRREAESF